MSLANLPDRAFCAGVLYFSQGGKLLQWDGTAVRKGTPAATVLADFSEMTFEEVETPEWAKHW